MKYRMRKNIRIGIYMFLLLTSRFLSAQDICDNQNHEQYLTGDVFYSYYLFYDGSPFYSDGWTTGSIKILSGETYDNLKIYYDTYKDDIIYYNKPIKRWILIDREIIDEVLIKIPNTQQELKLVHTYSVDTTANDKFYFVLNEGRVSLYLKTVKLMSKYTGKPKKGEFYDKSKCYFVLNNTFYQVPRHKRKLLTYFPKHATELKRFINKNGYSLKTHDDLINIFEEINRLY